jgi:hypothetical protein
VKLISERLILPDKVRKATVLSLSKGVGDQHVQLAHLNAMWASLAKGLVVPESRKAN